MFAFNIATLLTLLLLVIITEGGRRCSRKKLDIFIIVDGSRSVGSEEFNDVRRFLQKFVSRLDVGLGKTHVGLLLAERKDRTKIEISLGQYDSPLALRNATGRLKRSRKERSDMGYALELVQKRVFTDKEGDRRDVPDVLIVFTNGIRPIHLEDVLRRAHQLKKNNVEIITVYFKKTKMPWNIKDELTAIASIPANVLALQSNFKKLRRTLKRRICPSVRAMHPTKGCWRKNHDVFFVLDGSGSISLKYFERMKHFLVKLIKKLEVGPEKTHVGLLQFSHSLKTKIEFRLGELLTFDKIKTAIERMLYQEGGTDTGDALEIVNQQVFPSTSSYRPNVSDIVVILTDGEARDRKEALYQAEILRKKGVQIFAVGMGEQETIGTFRKDLELIASRPSDVFTADFKKLPYLVKTLTSEICFARSQAAMKCAHQKRDILIMVDGSASVGRKNFKKVKRFLRKLVMELKVGRSSNHIALLQYDEVGKMTVNLHFDDYYDSKKVVRAIYKMKYHSGLRTMTGHALAMADQTIFTGQRGDRVDARNVVILVADGGAHDKKRALDNAARLKKRGVQIVTIFIPNSTDKKESKKFLRTISSSSEDFYTHTFDELKYIAADLVKVVCINY